MRTLSSILAGAFVLAMLAPVALAVDAPDDDKKKEVVWIMTYSGGGG